jgi:hypothetical protein
VDSTISDLQKVHVASDDTRVVAVAWCELDAVLLLDRLDFGFREPDRHFDGERDAVVGEHEALERFVTQFVVADRRNDKCGRLGRCVLLAVDDGMRSIREFGSGLGSARLEILFSREQLVRADGGDAFEKVGDRCEACSRAGTRSALVVECAVSEEVELRAVVCIATLGGDTV